MTTALKAYFTTPPKEKIVEPKITLHVPFEPEYTADSGVISFSSWQSMKPHLEKIFGQRDNETLLGIKVTDQGITAIFTTTLSKKSKKKTA